MKLEKEIKLDNLSFFCGTAHFNCIIKELNQSDIDKLLKLKNEDRIKLTLEVEEPILDEAGRKYLSGVIRPFRDNIKSIKKVAFTAFGEFIRIVKKDNVVGSEGNSRNIKIDLPPFKKGTMYKKMVLNKEYTLDDLNL